MPLTIRYPRLDFEFPSEVAVLAVRHRPWTREAAGALAQRLDIHADAVDAGLWLIARDERSVLEMYQASQSFRYSRTDVHGEAGDGIGKSLILDEVPRIADRWIEPFLPQQGRAAISSVTKQELLVSEKPGDEPRAQVIAVDVNYRFEVEGLPLLGPGAKAKVSVHHAGGISGAYRFWRDVSPAGSVRTIPLDVLYERFSSSTLFTDLHDRDASSEVISARLGYLCLPPTEPMSILIPALELRGIIATEAQPRYEFVTHVAAIELDAQQAKEGHLINARPPQLLT
jgi:hypothetical protein